MCVSERVWLWLESAGDIATEVASIQILGGVGTKIGKKSMICESDPSTIYAKVVKVRTIEFIKQ